MLRACPQGVAHTSIQSHLLRLRPDCPRTCCIVVDALLTLDDFAVALRVAAHGVAAAGAQGDREPYTRPSCTCWRQGRCASVAWPVQPYLW